MPDRKRGDSDPTVEALGELGEQQLLVLIHAVLHGFFDQPREATAEDLADDLGMSTETFSRQLLSAEQVLFDRYFHAEAKNGEQE